MNAMHLLSVTLAKDVVQCWFHILQQFDQLYQLSLLKMNHKIQQIERIFSFPQKPSLPEHIENAIMFAISNTLNEVIFNLNSRES